MGKFTSAVDALGVVILCVMTVLITVAVVLRYLFGITYQWVEEVSLYGQIAIVLLMAGPLLYKEAHIRVDIVYVKLKNRARWAVNVINSLLILFMMSYIFVKSMEWVRRLQSRGLLTNSGTFKQWVPSSLVPIGFSVATVFAAILLVKTLARFKDLSKKDPGQ